MNPRIACILLLFCAVSQAAIAQTKPRTAPTGKVDVGSVANDQVCQGLFVPTGPMDALVEVAREVLMGRGRDQNSKQPLKPDQLEGDFKAAFKRAALTKTWLPVFVEERVGQFMLERAKLVPDSVTREGRKAKSYESVRAIFGRVVAALPAGLPYRFSLEFSQDADLNLSAIPGGMVIADQGVLGADPDLVAALIAHEIAHITKRHRTKQIQGYIADTMSIGKAVEQLARLRRTEGEKIDAWLGMARLVDTLFAAYHTDAELESDACVPRILKAAGFSPERGVKAFRDWALKQQDDAAKVPRSVAAPPAKAQPGAVKVNPSTQSAAVREVERQRKMPVKGRAQGRDESPQQTGEMFMRRHPAGPERVAVIIAALQFWAGRDASFPAVAADGPPSRPANSQDAAGKGESQGGVWERFKSLFDNSASPASSPSPASPASPATQQSQQFQSHANP